MILEENFEEQYKIGYPIFSRLFQLNKSDLLKVMIDIFQENKTLLDVLENNPSVKKL